MDTSPIALIERLDRDGHVLQSTPVYGWPLTIGRAFDVDLILDDPHVAPLHATLSEVDGVLQLSLGQTINGAMVGARHVQAGQTQPLDVAQAWRVGTTHLRVRRASEPVAPEQPLAQHIAMTAMAPAQSIWRHLVWWALASVSCILAELWLDSDPGSPINTYFSATLGLIAGMGVWALLWSLGSKLFQGRLQFTRHLRLVMVYGVVWSAVEVLMPLLAFVTGWSVLSHAADAVGAVVLCMLLWSHLTLILPGHRRGLLVSMVTLYVSGLGLNVWFNEERTGRVFSELYASSLLPPAWRLTHAQPAGALIQDAHGLKARLDRQAHDDEADEVADPADEE